MPVTSYLRARRRGRWSWHAGRVAVAGAALAAAAIAGSGGTPGGSAAHAVIATGATPAATMAQPSGQAPSATTSAAASAAATAPSRAPRRVVHTMSMDAPIQGGLTAHQEQALSARLVAAHRDAPLAGRSGYWTPAMAHTAVARARSWLGMPYSWAGGDATGPTTGRCDVHNGGDLDCHVVGFDCSGLAMYAWGPYASLPHLASAQRQAGAFHPTLAQLRPGDLVFFSAYLPGGTGHVAIYTGHGRVIEAPQSGSVIRRSTLSALMADDGTYRGAVRPLTGATPTLGTPQHTVSTLGGVVTLHGANLAQVSAVHLGGATVRSFYT
ncbi:C40 family peptidase, partial [Jatrophihabitans endophyticus]|uniref:C40 family peptidase n=1 Tax=Jatrophihabitans endophyticus TaxID=1206085 RepID=UPI0019E9C7EB